MENNFIQHLQDLSQHNPHLADNIEFQQIMKRVLAAGITTLAQALDALQSPVAALDLRTSIAWLMARLPEKSAAPILLRLAQNPAEPHALRFEAIQALGSDQIAAQATVPGLTDLIAHDPDVEIRAFCVNALGWLADQRACDVLLRLLCDQHEAPRLRGEAAEAIANGDFKQGIPHLIDVLDDPSAEVRFWASFALGQSGDPAAIPALENLLDDDEEVPGWWSVGKEAADAIEALREVEANTIDGDSET